MVDSITKHQILVNRFGAKLGRDAIPVLRQLQNEITARIIAAGDTIPSKKLMNEIRRDVDEFIRLRLGNYSDEITSELSEFISDEREFNQKTLNALVAASPKLIPRKTIIKDVLNTPMILNGEAVTLAQAQKRMSDLAIRKVNGAISAGYYQGQSARQITQQIGDMLRASSSNAQAIARTAVNHLANETRQQIYKENDDILQGYVISATLDTRTSDTCKEYDQRAVRFTDSFQPQPPFHYNCRTTTKPWLVDEDAPQEKPYYEWLADQDENTQNEALGKGKADLFRNGDMSPEEFASIATNRLNQPISLEKMREKAKRFN